MKKIIINHSEWQTRIALTQDNILENIYFSQNTQETLERSFFKGKISKVLPGIQTAFVDIDQDKAGFLHISEIDREMAMQKISKTMQFDEYDDQHPEPKPKPKRDAQKPDISKILKEGDNILVQVSKEPVYEKGAKLTTCFTLPGRYLVLMPNIPRFGVSKKIEDKEERNRLKLIIKQHIPEHMGAIIRTSAKDASAQDLVKDLNYLVNTWYAIEEKYRSAQSEEKIFTDLDLVLQTVRDHLDEQVDTIVVDDEAVQTSIYRFIRNIAPEYSHIIQFYNNPTSIFDYFDIEKQIQEALNKKVSLPSGGSLIIETTEAMTVIDVNTGKFIGKSNLEETILKTNLEAAQEITRQLRLRNIGGLIVIDFIDMDKAANRQKLFKFFEDTLKKRDKFQSVVLRISEFGLVQMTRKRANKNLVHQLMQSCRACHGLGMVKSLQTSAYDCFAHLKERLKKQTLVQNAHVLVGQDLFDYITSIEYNAILSLEKKYLCKIMIESSPTRGPLEWHIRPAGSAT